MTPRKKKPRHTEELSKADRAVLIAFGRRVVDRRQALEMSQQDLIDRVPLKGTGHTQAWLSRLEHGQTNVALLDIVKLARALEERPCELLTGS